MGDKEKPVIQTVKVSKSFSGVKVLSDIDFDLRSGEIHALVGENGAGKSTLMKIICGIYTSSSGKIILDGKKVNMQNPHDALGLGIALIHQEPLTFPDLNVTENIFVGHTRQDRGVVIDWEKKHIEAREILDSLGVNLNERACVKHMSIADQQMVEIAGALSQHARIIVMDEPTTAVTTEEVKMLFDIMRMLKEQGKSVVFISHKIDEVLEITDRVTVLRDGEKIDTCDTKDLDEDMIIKMMIGRSIKEQIPKENAEIGEVVFSVKNLSLQGELKNISIDVRKGEIVGLAGLVGAGRSEFARAVFGITPPTEGEVFLKGKKINTKITRDIIESGIAYLPEDRALEGLFVEDGIATNMTFAIHKKISRRGWINLKLEKVLVSEYIKKLRIKLKNQLQEVRELSGGNQQKLFIAKWLLVEPEVLILDEPTRGIDVGAKLEVYHLINELAKSGKAIIMISSELREISSLSDRVYVMREGSISAHFDRQEMSDEKIMAAATGIEIERR